MTVNKRVFNNMFWIFVSEAISKAVIFLGTIYLARVLGKAGFGLFSLSLAIGVYFWTVVDLGVMGYGTREIAKNRAHAAQLYSILNSIRFILAIGLFLLFCAALYFINIPLEKKLVFLAGCFFIVGYSLSPGWVLGGLEKMQFIAFGSLISSLFFLIGIYIYVKSATGVFAASLIYSCSFLVGSLILMLILYKKLKIPFCFTLSFKEWLLHIKESFYFAINSAFNNVSIYIPIFFMGMWSSAEDLGTFSAPHRLVMFFTRASGLIIAALYPVLSNLYVTDMDVFRKTHFRFQKIIVWISIPVCIIATMFSKEMVTFLFGANYADSAGIFNVLIWMSFLLVLRYSLGNALLSAGFHRFNMLATGVGTAVVTLVSIVLIPHHSSFGAVWALFAGEIFTLVLMIGLFRRKLYSLNSSCLYLIRVIVVALIMFLIIRVFHFSAVLSAILGILVYGALSLVMGIVNKNGITQIYQGLLQR